MRYTGWMVDILLRCPQDRNEHDSDPWTSHPEPLRASLLPGPGPPSGPLGPPTPRPTLLHAGVQLGDLDSQAVDAVLQGVGAHIEGVGLVEQLSEHVLCMFA